MKTSVYVQMPKQLLAFRKNIVYIHNKNTINFRFSPFIIIVNHFYCPTNALKYIKLGG